MANPVTRYEGGERLIFLWRSIKKSELPDDKKLELIDRFLWLFANEFFCRFRGEDDKFEESWKAVLARTADSFNRDELESFNITSSQKKDYRSGIRRASLQFVNGPFYRMKRSYFDLHSPSRQLAARVFEDLNSVPPAVLPKVYIASDGGNLPARSKVARKAIRNILRWYNLNKNKKSFNIGLSSGSTVMRLVTVFSTRIDEDPEFKKLLARSKYRCFELSSTDIYKDYLTSSTNCWVMYQSMREYDLITQDGYVRFSKESDKPTVVCCGIGSPDTQNSREFHDYMKTAHPGTEDFSFEINETPYYQGKDGWHTLDMDHPHMSQVHYIPALKAQKVILCAGKEKAQAIVNLLRANLDFYNRNQELICTEIIMDTECFEHILNNNW